MHINNHAQSAKKTNSIMRHYVTLHFVFMSLEMKRLGDEDGTHHIHATIQNNILKKNTCFNFLRFFFRLYKVLCPQDILNFEYSSGQMTD